MFNCLKLPSHQTACKLHCISWTMQIEVVKHFFLNTRPRPWAWPSVPTPRSYTRPGPGHELQPQTPKRTPDPGPGRELQHPPLKVNQTLGVKDAPTDALEDSLDNALDDAPDNTLDAWTLPRPTTTTTSPGVHQYSDCLVCKLILYPPNPLDVSLGRMFIIVCKIKLTVDVGKVLKIRAGFEYSFFLWLFLTIQ